MVARVILGNLGDGYGLRVSKPGYDVNTAAKGDLLFDSVGSGYLRERAYYTVSFTTATTQYINHNLGVVPIVLWFEGSGTGGTRFDTNLTIWSSTTQIAISNRLARTFTVTLQLLTDIV